MGLEGLKRMNDTIQYIEEHLDKKVDIDKLAGIAYLSKFHFQRLFHMITGVTVAEYIRKRRLTLAAQELIASDSKIIDLSLKYGYDTPESFSRAFRIVHGMSPSQARKAKQRLKAYPKLSFQIHLKGEEDMNYRIEKREGFKVAGKEIRTSTKNGENSKRIPQFWEELNGDGTVEKLIEHSGELGVLGVCMEFAPQMDELTYVIGMEKTEAAPMEELVEKEIPKATWAVFEAVGPMPDAIQKVWKRIFSEWFPSTGYEHANAPELEVYLPGNPNDEDYRSEVWIPIIDNK
ncbi:AraC family transcriptional regulator [Gracilibacillus xinjiangensis]|uniref:Effector binding domain-containing protein n=1 Tax=Gracilibacillus xinjiangensis TaxID=1193282 RepID=A0ABV8WWS7_9BACI